MRTSHNSDEEMLQLEDELADREQLIETMEEELHRRDEQIAKLQEDLTFKDNTLDFTHQILVTS